MNPSSSSPQAEPTLVPANEQALQGMAKPVACWRTDAQRTITSITGPGVPWIENLGDVVGQPSYHLLPEGVTRTCFAEACDHASDGSPQTMTLKWKHHVFSIHLETGGSGFNGMCGVLLQHPSPPETQPSSAHNDIYKDMVERSLLSIHQIDTEGRISEINQAGLDILGVRNKDNVLGKDYLSLVHGEDRSRIEELMQHAFRGTTAQFAFSTTDGRIFESSFVPQFNTAGEVTSLFGMSQDVTTRTSMERALRDSERRYRLLVEQSPYCIHQIDLDGNLISMNRSGLKMMGVKDESEIKGMPYLDATAPHDTERIGALMQDAFRGIASLFEFEAVNGLIFASSFIPLMDSTETLIGLMGITQDITKRKKAEQALIASEQRLELALSGAKLGVWDQDLKSSIVIFNDRMDHIFGFEEGHAKTAISSILGFVLDEDRAEVERRRMDHLEGRTPEYHSEHRIKTLDGDIKWVVERGMIVEREPDGTPTRFSGITLEITDRKLADTQRKELETQLQQAQKMESVGQLAGGVAHDFNNLLQVILGHVDFALSDADPASESAEDLTEIKRAAERAADLTRRLLALSRQQHSERSVIDLNTLISNMLSMVSRVLPETIDLRLISKADLPLVEVDSGQIEQALLNLCVNARDAMPDGGHLTITTDHANASLITNEPGSFVSIKVSDDGVGMDEDVLAHAIEPFFTTKGPQKGTGLGLAMVYGLTTQNQGTLHIDSVPGQGTDVQMTFPESDLAASETGGHPEEFPCGGHETILVVEDEAAVRTLTERMLIEAGYTVITAENGAHGLEQFEAHQGTVDLALIDAVMPIMTGRELCEHLQSRAPDLNILFMSGYHQGVAISETFLEERGLEVLSKPFTSETLLKKIRSVLADAR